MRIIEYEDHICCDHARPIIENELVDTHGGDDTYADTYVCDRCKRAFLVYNGGRFEGAEEVDYKNTGK